MEGPEKQQDTYRSDKPHRESFGSIEAVSDRRMSPGSMIFNSGDDDVGDPHDLSSQADEHSRSDVHSLTEERDSMVDDDSASAHGISPNHFASSPSIPSTPTPILREQETVSMLRKDLEEKEIEIARLRVSLKEIKESSDVVLQRLEDELEEQSLELKECEADLFASNTKCKALARSLKDERAKGRAERGDEDVGVEEELERLRIEYAKCKDDLSYCEEELEEARAEAEEFKKVMMDSELKQQQANRESLDEIARLKRLVSSLQANQREGAGRGLEGDLDEAPSGDLDANSNGLDLISAPSNQGQGQGQGLDEAAIQERVRRLNSQLQTCKERACALLHDEI